MKRLFASTMLLALCLAQAQTDLPQRGNRGRGAIEQQPPATSPAAGGQGGQQRPAPPLEEEVSYPGQRAHRRSADQLHRDRRELHHQGGRRDAKSVVLFRGLHQR